MKTLEQCVESLQNIIDDSEMDTGDSYFCETCKRMHGDEKVRDDLVQFFQDRIEQVLGEEALSDFILARIEHGSTCLGKPEFCSKFQND